MARIQIEYTASVEAYKAKLQELIALNETLMRASNSANVSIQNLNKSASQAGGTSKIASQANTAQKEAEKAQKAAEAAEKAKAKAAEAAEAAKIKAAEKAQKVAEALAKKSQKEAEAAEKAKVKAAEASENAKVRAAEAAAKKREAAEFRILLAQERKEKAAVKATEAAENARVKAAEKAAKERERLEKQAIRATEMAEKQRVRVAQREAKERERLEKQAVRAAEMAEKQRVRATQQAEKERVRATQQAERERARASQERMRAEQNVARPLQGITSYVSAAFAIGSIVNFTKELVQLIAQLEIVQSRFNFIYNGQEEGEKGFLRLSERIRTLGLDYQSTIEQFSSFSIAAQQANFTVLQTEDMFVRFASSLRAVGASNLQVQRSFYALQQMMSKGVVAAEELRRQMGESLPGAASIMYQAYKKLHPESVQTERDFMKLQEQGKILSREVLPEFINMLEKTFAPALESKMNSLTATIERTEQAWLDFKFTLLDVQPIKNALNTITEKLRDFTNVSKARNLTAAEKDAYDRGVIGDVIIGAGVGATLLKLIPTLVNGFFTFLIQKAPQIGFNLAKAFTAALSTIKVSGPAFLLSLQGDTAEGSSALGNRAKSRMDYEERRRIFAAEVEAKKRTQIENDLRKRYPELNGEAFAKRVQQALAIEMAKISSLKIGIDVKNLNTGLVQARGQVSAKDLFSSAELARLDYEARVAEAEKAASERQEASQRFRGLDQEGRESFIQTLTKELDFYGKKVEEIEQKFKDFPEKAEEEIKKLNERLRETGTLSANALNLPVGTRLTTGDLREMLQAYLADYLKIHQSLLETDLKREEEDKNALEARQKYLQGLVDLAKIAVEKEKFQLQKRGKDELGMETTNSKNLLELQKKLSKAELDLANHNDRESSQKLLANKQEYQLKVEKLDYEFSEYEKNVAYERGVRTINEQKAVLEKNLINLKEYQKESLQNTLDALDKDEQLLKIGFEKKEILEEEYSKRLEDINKKRFDATKKYNVAILDLELASVEKKISLVQQEFASFEMMTSDEMRLKEEAMRIEMEREIKQNELLGELAEARREKFNAEVKKMYADARKEDKEYFQDLKDYIEEPFLSSGTKEIKDIDKEVQDRIVEYTQRVMAGRVRGTGAVEGFDPTTGLPQVSQGALVTVGSKEYNDTVDKIRQSGEKRKEGITENPFGLNDEQLRQIKDALNIVGNAFKDLYDLRMELARRANEAELEMLEKRFNAGLMRENEYNEKVAEIKKRQALAERDAAKFGIVLDTAQGIARIWAKNAFAPPVAAALTALLLGVSAAQLNAVSSAPLPTFHEGGLDIRKNSKKKPDNGLKSDEFYAKLQEGESVMTREETRKYKDVLKAIREDAMPIELMKAYKLPAYPRSIDKPSLMASNNTSLELAYQNAELVDAVKRNGAVTIRNANDIAEAIVSKSSFMKIANRRRIK
jgi:tape measure domain-containing protein